MSPKFARNEKVFYYGLAGTVVSVEQRVKYVIRFVDGRQVGVYESDLTSAETTESEWEADGGS